MNKPSNGAKKKRYVDLNASQQLRALFLYELGLSEKECVRLAQK